MFYSQFILAKKGPLGTIWIAAHLERKLRKNQVADTDIGVSVDSILFPDVPIALRLSSHLLLGVVRIYSRKVNYLFDDCSEALLKVKQAFRSAAVDLPPEQSKAPYHSITLPETFDLDDFEISDNEISQGKYVDHHVSTKEQITLQDTMDGVAFPRSQFGPDERFGDGDAFQIGLDFEEELLLSKGEAAGTSEVLMDMDADLETSMKASAPPISNDHNEGIANPSLASPANYASIQAPSTPRLIEEPNFPIVQEALISDDHMDEDHNPLDSVVKEVAGPPSQPEPSNFGNDNYYANGDFHKFDEHETEKAKSVGPELPNKTMELTPTDDSKPLPSGEHVETTSGLDSKVNYVDGFVDYERNMAGADIQPEVRSEVDEVGISKVSTPLPEISPVTEVHSTVSCAGNDIANVNGIYCLMPDTTTEHDKASVGFEVPSADETECIVKSSSEQQNENQPCLNLEISEALGSNIDETLSTPSVPVLQACNSHVQQVCNESDSVVNASSILGKDGRLSSWGSGRENSINVFGISTEVQDTTKSNLTQINHQFIYGDASSIRSEDGRLSSLGSGRENSINVSGISTEVQDTTKSNLTQINHQVIDGDVSSIRSEYGRLSSLGSGRENSINVSGISAEVQDTTKSNLTQINHQFINGDESYLDGKLENKISGEHNLEQEKDISGFSMPEKLLDMPNVLTGQPDGLFVESTPAQGNVLQDHGDATTENFLSGRKRSYTESTLTMQSLNSAETYGAAQSKGSGEIIPDDDDLLSSILAGKKSTTLKMKPTPPVTDTVPVKRQRVAVRASSAHKRRVLIDDAVVLHGDTIRQQLTNTEDIRRVRRKAPCTHLEIWTLQKQFLKDEIFYEPVLTGMSSILLLQSETMNLSRARIVDKDVSKGANELDKSIGATFDEKSEFMGTLPSTARDDGDQGHRGGQESPNHQEFMVSTGCSSLQKVTTVDHEVTKNDSEYCASDKRVVAEINDGMALDSEAMNPGQKSARGPVVEVTCNSSADATVDLSHLNQIGDLLPVHIDESSLEDTCGAGIREQEDLINNLDSDGKVDGKCLSQETEAMVEVIPKTDVQDHCSLPLHDVSVPASKSLEGVARPTFDQVMEEYQLNVSVPLDGSLSAQAEMLASYQIHDTSGLTSKDLVGEGSKLDSSCTVEADLHSQNTLIPKADVQDHCSIPVNAVNAPGSVSLEGGACATSDQVMEEYQLGMDVPQDSSFLVHDEIHAFDHRNDTGGLTSDNVGEGLKFDASCSVEADFSSQNTLMTETEKLECWDTDAKVGMYSTTINTDYICIGEHAEFGTDAIDHDTDFLNVDDDDAAVDYESDVPNDEEKRTLDNTGWSSRTRAVANYLQTLFEKDTQHRNEISLSSLLAAKSRKEASRMFFETLVLKTKDYVHAEQESCYADIRIKPRGKLMKSEF